MKKQSIGIWINIVTAIMTLVAVIAYNVNISSEGYFKNANVGNLVMYCSLAIVMLVVVVALAQLNLDGSVSILVDVVSGILRIVIPVLLTLALASLISGRAEGLGFIFLSNEEVLLEIQTTANMSSASGTITNMVCLGVAAVLAMVAAFFNLEKKAA